MKPVVIYDDKCHACTAFGTWGRSMIPLGYTTAAAKRLMRAQFGKDYGFALMIFTHERVFWGSEAAAMITKVGYSSSISTAFNRLIHFIYPHVVSLMNIIYGRKKLPMAPSFKAKRLADNGSMPLSKAAKVEYRRIYKLCAKNS